MADSSECCELAAHILGIEEYEDEEQVWVKLWDQHEIDEESFGWLIKKLLPLMNIGESFAHDVSCIGFAKKRGGGVLEFIVKKDYEKIDSLSKHMAMKWAFDEMKKCDDSGFEMNISGPEGKLKMTVEKVE